MKRLFIFLMFFFATFVNVVAEGNYVTSITVDGVAVEGIDNTKEEQTFEIKDVIKKDNVAIVYEYDKNTYQIQGSYGQEVSLDYGKNEKTLTITNKTDANDKKVYHLIITREDSRSGDNSLASLTVGGKQVVLGNGNDYTVDVDSKLTGITIDAKTSNDKASFVDGYGPRTIDKDSPGCEIKVKAENEQIRTYNIKITKSNAKSNDANLKELKIDSIDLDFKPTTYEYALTAKSNISKIKITATPNSDKASIEYKQEVTLVSGENIVEIKVTAEDSSTKTYKLTITKEEEKPIVTDIKIKDVEFTFDPKKYSYTIETELKTLDFDITLSDENAKYEIEGNEELKNKSVVTLKVTLDDKTTTYKFKILNKTETNKEEKDTSKKTTGNNENIFEKNEMLFSLIIFGIGIFGTLGAILLKPKKVK